MKTLHFLFFIFCGIGILVVLDNIANVQACTSYENCVRTLPHQTTQTASFNGNHATYGIPYNLSNATLVTSLLDLPARELIFELNATDAGQLMVELPRNIIDSTRDGTDKPYLIFVGDILSGTKRIKANEVQTTDTNRTLKINFTKNDNMIGIVSTYFIENNSTAKIRNGYGAWSPLQQYQKGFDAQDIVCKNEFILVVKTEDGFPACVKPDTAQKLVERGWTKEIVTNTSTESSTLNKTTANELKIDLSNQTYDAGYPVYVNLKGVNQDSTCKIPSISVRDESDQSIVFGPTPDRSYVGGCVDPWPITFYAGLEKNTLITKSTRYSILATLDNKTYQKEFTVIPSLYSNKNITADSTHIMPGYLTFTSCLPVSDIPNNGTLISYTGFDMYRRYLAGPDTGGIPEIDNYLLKPGSTGSFVLQVHQGQFSKDANLAGGLYFLSENLLNLDNSTVLNNKPLASEEHPGLVLSYTPSFAKAGPEGYATITASISAQQDATRGTYWLYLPPGICGGDRVLLTIGEQPLAQPPDYIGYDFASHFAQGVGNPTQSDVTFELINAGIHTFENCSVIYVSNNQTTTIKTFSVIPPGMEYKYHANLTSTSKVSGFLECKNPPMTKVYPDVWVDVIPY